LVCGPLGFGSKKKHQGKPNIGGGKKWGGQSGKLGKENAKKGKWSETK